MGTDGSQGSGAITADPGERSALHRVEGLFAGVGAPMLVGQDGEQIPLPDSVLRVLRQTVHHLAQGESVTVMPVEAELSTQEAADLLRVSRPYLVKLLEQGDIPFVKTGAHRRIRSGDLLEYKRCRDAGRRQTLARLT
jgi:excisionase family DNA binding protein